MAIIICHIKIWKFIQVFSVFFCYLNEVKLYKGILSADRDNQTKQKNPCKAIEFIIYPKIAHEKHAHLSVFLVNINAYLFSSCGTVLPPPTPRRPLWV